MASEAQFKAAYPYQKDVLALPMTDERNGKRFQVRSRTRRRGVTRAAVNEAIQPAQKLC
jgi:hypothetical protein